MIAQRFFRSLRRELLPQVPRAGLRQVI